ncbi:uncharacterized protein METZ01_LOCUS78637, partial [marine metagenome]
VSQPAHLAKRYLASPWRLGRKAIEVCSEKWQTQP